MTRPAIRTPRTRAEQADWEAHAEQQARTYYRLVDSGDVTGLLALFTEDCVYRRPGYPPLAGRTELAASYEGQRIIAEGRHTVSTLTCAWPQVSVTGAFHGTLKDGSPVSLEFADFFTTDPDGLFSRRQTYFFTPLV